MKSEFYRDQPTDNMPLTHRDNHIFIFLLCEFDFLKEHGFVSVIFVTDGRNMYHAPSRYVILYRGQVRKFHNYLIEWPTNVVKVRPRVNNRPTVSKKLSGHCVVFVKPEILGLTHGL